MRPQQASLLQKIGDLALRAGFAALSRAGEPARDRLGTVLGWFSFDVLRIRRAVMELNLRGAFPQQAEPWLRSTARAAYSHFGRETLAVPSLAATTPAEIIERTALVGLDDLEAALARGRGVVLVTAHVGNWEMGGAALAARGFPLDVVTQRQRSQTFDRLLLKSRQRLGMRVIDRHDAHRAVLRSLRQGRMVAFVADQDAREAGTFVPFFGKPASTHRGPALLALRAGAPLFVGVALRVGRRSYRVELREIVPPGSGRLRARVNQLTSIFTSEFERVIREAPDQYLWHHRRWKTAPLPMLGAANPCPHRAVPAGAEALQHGGEPA